MKYILDTHVFIWYAEGDNKLSLKAKKLIDNVHDNDELFISMASVWEMTIKISLGKLVFHRPFKEIFEEQIVLNNYQLLDIKVKHTEKIISLPFHHKDPFDRLIIAQSLTENIPVISIDNNFPKYSGLSVIW